MSQLDVALALVRHKEQEKQEGFPNTLCALCLSAPLREINQIPILRALNGAEFSQVEGWHLHSC